MDLIPANSLTFEAIHIMAQRCVCGGEYRIKAQYLTEVEGKPVDRIEVVCVRCGNKQDFYFDVHTFYGQEERYGRFEETEAALRSGLAAIHEERWEEAELQLRQVVHPVEGEPAFGWGHYHLGMVLLVQGRHEEGLDHIRRALALNPRETEFYRGLSKGLRAEGREDEAERAWAEYQRLKELAAQGPESSVGPD